MSELITSINLHLTDDTKIVAKSYGKLVWIGIGASVAIFIDDENVLGELAGAIDQASKFLMK